MFGRICIYKRFNDPFVSAIEIVIISHISQTSALYYEKVNKKRFQAQPMSIWIEPQKDLVELILSVHWMLLLTVESCFFFISKPFQDKFQKRHVSRWSNWNVKGEKPSRSCSKWAMEFHTILTYIFGSAYFWKLYKQHNMNLAHKKCVNYKKYTIKKSCCACKLQVVIHGTIQRCRKKIKSPRNCYACVSYPLQNGYASKLCSFVKIKFRT